MFCSTVSSAKYSSTGYQVDEPMLHKISQNLTMKLIHDIMNINTG